MLNLIRKALRYRMARQKWVEAGKPLRSPEYIAELFDTHCGQCDEFIPTGENRGVCDLCDCHIKREGEHLNKLAWPTEGCPDIPPKWIADVEAADGDN